MNDIDKLINDAETQSQQVQDRQLPATASDNTQVVAKPSLDNLLNSGMSVDTYLKVSEDGLKVVVDDKSTLFENVEVTIDMAEVVPTTVVKYGNPATYHKTFDGVTTTDGGRWTDAIETAARFGATPYASSDIPMTLNEPIKDRNGKEVLGVGTRIGYSLSTTNREAFARFFKEVNENNLRHSRVECKLGYEPKKNKKNNVWGVVTFEFLGEASE